MLKGIDVSQWQGNMDFLNHDFVMIKASEGVGYKDKMLDTHYNNVRKNGVECYGFYHYARPETGNSPESEADYFLSLVGHHQGNCIYALDWEGESLSCSTSWAFRWLERVYQKTGVRPLIYLQASQEWTSNYLDIIKANYGLWIAHWGVNKPTVKHWNCWAMWQFTDSPLDTNYFNGNKDTWYAYCKKEQNSNIIDVGTTVRVKTTVDYNGTHNAEWVLNCNFEVMEIKDDRVVIGNNGAITGVWHIRDLEL